MGRSSSPQDFACALLEVLTAPDAAELVVTWLRAKTRRLGLGGSIRVVMSRLDALRSELAAHAGRADSESARRPANDTGKPS